MNTSTPRGPSGAGCRTTCLRLADALAGRADIEMGEDTLGFARRLAEDAARQVRAQEIGERIRAGGGRLPGVRATLYPYQVDGVAFLAGRGRALLADDMGLGKTLQAIAAAHWLHQHDQVERVLVVCPASLKHQWAREIAKFTGAEAQVVQGPVAARAVQYRKGTGFYVINYELVLRDLILINETLGPDLLILDEAQRIKNWRTRIASAVKQIPSRYAFVLTGTPLENRLEDLYSLMQVVDPRVLGPLWRYLVDFHITDERGKVLGYRNLSELRRRLAPVMLRRDRSLVRDQLPERIEQRLDCALTDTQRGIHDDARERRGHPGADHEAPAADPVRAEPHDGRPATGAHGLRRRRAGGQGDRGLAQARRVGDHPGRAVPAVRAQGRGLLPVGAHDRDGGAAGAAHGARARCACMAACPAPIAGR